MNAGPPALQAAALGLRQGVTALQRGRQSEASCPSAAHNCTAPPRLGQGSLAQGEGGQLAGTDEHGAGAQRVMPGRRAVGQERQRAWDRAGTEPLERSWVDHGPGSSMMGLWVSALPGHQSALEDPGSRWPSFCTLEFPSTASTTHPSTQLFQHTIRVRLGGGAGGGGPGLQVIGGWLSGPSLHVALGPCCCRAPFQPAEDSWGPFGKCPNHRPRSFGSQAASQAS